MTPVKNKRGLSCLTKWLCFSLCILLFLIGSAYAESAVFILDTTPDRLKPIAIRTPQTFPVSMQIYEGLFGLNQDGRVIPKLIAEWDTEDYQTWRLQVRAGVLFHPSDIFPQKTRAITAEDVVYSLEQFCRPESFNSFLLLDSVKGAAAFNQGKSDRVSGIRLVDAMRLEIELVKPERFFINRLSTNLICVYPKEMDQERYKDDVGFSLAIGTGPYRLVSRTETEVVLVKNGAYWDQQNQPAIDEWTFRIVQNEQSRLAALKRRNADVMVLPGSLYPAILNKDGTLQKAYSQNYRLASVPTFNSHLIGFNLDKVKDVNLRRAMSLATNRAQMTDTLFLGHADVTGGAVPPGMNGYQPPADSVFFNPEMAKEYLAKSSYQGEPLELIVHDTDNSALIGQIFQSQMAEIGIRINLQKMDFGGAVGRIIKGEAQLFNIFFEYVFSSPEPVLINLFSSSKIPVPNFFHYANPAIDQQLEALYTMTEDEALTASQQIEAQVMADAPAIFLYRQHYALLYSKKIDNLHVTGNNHYLLEKVTTAAPRVD